MVTSSRPRRDLLRLIIAWVFGAAFCSVVDALAVGQRNVVLAVNDPILEKLLAKNAAWAKKIDTEIPGFFKDSAKGQHPKALWIGCSDSRVPESVIMDVLPGQIFTQRNIANQVPQNDTNAIAVISYAVEHLEVDRIVVAGHTHCGGVEYCYNHAVNLPSPPPRPLPPLPEPVLNAWLGTLYARAVTLFNGKPIPRDIGLSVLTHENVRMQVQNVAGLEVVKHAWKEGRDLKVVGWLYEIEYGRLTDLGICVGPGGAPCVL